MTWRERYSLAFSSYVTGYGLAIAFMIGIFMLFIPSLIWPEIFIVTQASTIPIINRLVVGIIVWLLVVIVIFLFVVLTLTGAGFISMAAKRYFEDGADWWLAILIFFPLFVWTTYKMAFGDYFKKWYFLKVWFRPKEVAKDLLLED